MTLELASGTGSLLQALDQAPESLVFSTTELSQARAVGTVLAEVSVVDANAVFGDRAALSFVDRARGLSALQAASILRFEGASLVSAASDLARFGADLALTVRATDLHGLSRDFDVTLNLRAPSVHAPEGGADAAVGTEDAPLVLDLFANDRDLDLRDRLVLVEGAQGPKIEAVWLQTQAGLVDLAQAGVVTLRATQFAAADLMAELSAGLSVTASGWLTLTLSPLWDAILRNDGSGLYQSLDLRLSYLLGDDSGAVSAARTQVSLTVTGAQDIQRGTAQAEVLRLALGGELVGGGGAGRIR